jgi:hypothetical protein
VLVLDDQVGDVSGLEMNRGGSRLEEQRARHGLSVSAVFAMALAVIVVSMCCCIGVSWGASYSVLRFGEHAKNKNEGAGLLQGAVGVGVDAKGDVFVVDPFEFRVDEFSSGGAFLRAWGWGVVDGQSRLEVCTSSCLTGLPGSGAGQFDFPGGLAVDPVSGSVYVFDLGNHRVEKFGLEGQFELMFGGGVNRKGGDICTGGEEAECQAGSEGTGIDEFGGTAVSRNNIAVGGPGGRVYVGDTGRVQVFEPDGVFLESISLAGLSSTASTGEVRALAVDGAGNVFVKVGGEGNPSFPPERVGAVPGVHKFERAGVGLWTESSMVFADSSKNNESEAVEALTSDGVDGLYVGDSAGGFHVIKYNDTSGVEFSTFGFDTSPDSLGMAFSRANGVESLYITSITEPNPQHPGLPCEFCDLVWGYTIPGAGPLIEPGSERVVPEPRGAVKFEATVDPEGGSTEVKVEYVDDVDFASGGFASLKTKSSTPVIVASGFEDKHVQVELPRGTLMPGVGYHFRLVAANPSPVSGAGGSFVELPAAVVEGPWASEVSSSGVTLSAGVNPGGVRTSYKLEYGVGTSYGAVLSGNVGEGLGFVLVSHHFTGLSPSTVYHYRLVTVNSVGTVVTSDHVFTTQSAVALTGLIDGREWELVSPADKHGALIEPSEGRFGDVQAAAGGMSVGYLADEPVTSSPPGDAGVYVLSSRKPNGNWGSLEILPSQIVTGEELSAGELAHGNTFPMLFSPDMSRSVIEPDASVPVSSLSPVCTGASPATERTIVLRVGFSDACYIPLVTAANVPAGVKFGGSLDELQQMNFLAASRNLEHVVFTSPFALTPGAMSLIVNGHCGGAGKGSVPECQPFEYNLYEWSGGVLRQVNILPDNESGGPTFSAFLGRRNADVAGSVSDDGRWVVWEYFERERDVQGLYIRDMVDGKSLRIGGSHVVFQSMDGDGSRVFFLEGKRVNGVFPYDLYVFDTGTGTVTDLTGDRGAGESRAGVQDSILGMSEDGSSVYFVATGVLAEGAVGGMDNLYFAHEEGGVWKIKLVAVLSSDDEKDWSALDTNEVQHELDITSRVSSDGRFLAFMSDRPLTGYDNVDVASGRPDEEVYEYDSSSSRLVCVSCNPYGVRPAGVFDPGGGVGALLVDRPGAWDGHWLAGSMGGWRVMEGSLPVYEPRNLLDGGRLFFESSDALVPSATNGLEDVYEYEPVGGGIGVPANDSCSVGSAGYSERLVGCVGLISSGTSSAESEFYDSSESGDDVFFATSSKLVSADYDKSVDVYDAHACFVLPPCVASSVSLPQCSSGDACKPPPSAQPEIFGPPPSETFSGQGGVVKPAVKAKGRRGLTRAQRLKRALHACRKVHGGARRAKCVRTARRQYGARRAVVRGVKARGG